MQTLIGYLKKYYHLFLIFLPLWFIFGNAFEPINFVFIPLCLGWLYYKERHDAIILALLMILILGDSRSHNLDFVKNVRIVVVMTIFAFSIWDIYTQKYGVKKLFLWILPFIFSALLSIYFSDSRYTQYYFTNGVFKTLSYGIVIFITFHYIKFHLERLGGELLLDILMLCNGVLTVGLLFIPLFPELVIYGDSGRFRGLLGNPNGMGKLITVIYPLFFFYFTNKQNVAKWFKVMSYGLILVSLFLCTSRNAIFAFALFYLIVNSWSGSIYKKALFLLGILPLMGILLYAFSVKDFITMFGLEQYFRIGDIESGSGRIYAWKWALELINDRPWLGAGFSYDEFMFAYHLPTELFISGHQGGVHNSYLKLVLNTGIIGASFLIMFFVRVLGSIRNYTFFLPFLASTLFSATFESWLGASLNGFTIFFLIMIMILLSPDFTEKLQRE